MIEYVIRHTFQYEDKKSGETKTMTSYFQRQSGYPIPLKHMVGKPEEAKKFDCRSEAKRFISRTWGKHPDYFVDRIVTESE